MTGIARGRAVGSGRRRRLLVPTLFVVAMTTACTDTDPPQSGLPTGSSVSQSPSDSPPTSEPDFSPTPSRVPVLPKAAQSKSLKGAESFYKYFMAVYSFSYAQANPTLLRQLSDTECSFCMGAITRIERLAQSGAKLEGGDVAVKAVIAVPGGEQSEGVVLSATLDQAKGIAKDRDGLIKATTPAARNLTSQARVRWIAGGWRMWALRIEAEN